MFDDVKKFLKSIPDKLVEPPEPEKTHHNIVHAEQCTCGKVTYASRYDAEKAVKLLSKKHKRNRGVNAYLCDICGKWHLSSKTYRKQVKKNSKRNAKN